MWHAINGGHGRIRHSHLAEQLKHTWGLQAYMGQGSLQSLHAANAQSAPHLHNSEPLAHTRSCSLVAPSRDEQLLIVVMQLERSRQHGMPGWQKLAEGVLVIGSPCLLKSQGQVQMDQAKLGGRILHRHALALPPPWRLLQQVVRDRSQELRTAARLQVATRRPVIWHLDLATTAVQTSAFRPSPH